MCFDLGRTTTTPYPLHCHRRTPGELAEASRAGNGFKTTIPSKYTHIENLSLALLKNAVAFCEPTAMSIPNLNAMTKRGSHSENCTMVGRHLTFIIGYEPDTPLNTVFVSMEEYNI